MQIGASNFRSTLWLRGRNGVITPIRSSSTTWKTTVRSSRAVPKTQLQECRQEVEEVARKIAAEEFEAKPGFYCRFCAYRSLCPATEKRLYTIPSIRNQAAETSSQKLRGRFVASPRFYFG